MTLGRALQESGHAADARAEFEYVLSLAPDNLAAIRGLAELHSGSESASPVAAPAPMPVRSPEPAPAPAAVLAIPPPPPLPPPEPELVPVLELDPPIKLEPKIPRAAQRDAAPHSDPDLAALDASFDAADGASAASAERAAQIERLEIWLAKLEQARESTHDHA